MVRLLSKKAEHGDIANTGLRKEESRWETLFVDDGEFYGSSPVRGAGVVGGDFVVTGEGNEVVLCKGWEPIRGGVLVGERRESHDEL